MGPTEILRAEHQVILRALDILDHLATAESVDPQAAALLVDFLRTYADTYHHLKEEHQLFPALGECGMPRHVGPVAVMLDDHAAGRQLVDAMATALDAGDLEAYREPARHFVALLRDHIGKEDQVLFPMADGMVPPEKTTALLAAYEEIEEQCGARAEELRRQVLELGERWAVPAATHAAHGCMGGTCGSHP